MLQKGQVLKKYADSDKIWMEDVSQPGTRTFIENPAEFEQKFGKEAWSQVQTVARPGGVAPGVIPIGVVQAPTVEQPAVVLPGKVDTEAIASINKIPDAIAPVTAGFAELQKQYAELQKEFLDTQKAQQEAATKQKTEAQAEQKKWYELWKTQYKAAPVMETKLEDLYVKYKIPETYEQQRTLVGEISGLNTSIINLTSEMNIKLNRSEDTASQRGLSTYFLEGEQAQIQKEYNMRISTASAELGAKAAYMQALQGNISQARDMIQDTIKAATYDQEYKMNELKAFTSYNSDLISNLSTELQNDFKNMLDMNEKAYNTAKDERQKVADLFLAAPDAGIDILHDTPEEATRKAGVYTERERVANQIRDLITKYPTAGIQMTDNLDMALAKAQEAGATEAEIDLAYKKAQTTKLLTPTEKNVKVNYFTDVKGMVTKVVTDPATGKEISREEVGKVGRAGSIYAFGFDESTDMDNILDEVENETKLNETKLKE